MENSKFVYMVPEGKIKDYVDGKLRKETPEEYVRQTVEKRLINEHKYSREQIKVEFPVQMGSGKKRADIVIFDEETDEIAMKDQHNIVLIIECKKESISPSDKINGVEQLKSYMAACSNCKWGMWTNGLYKSVFLKIIDESGKIVFEDFNDIPSAEGKFSADEGRPVRSALIKAYEDNLLFTFKICHNIIYVNEGLQKQPAFFEFLKIIFCKISDERNLTKPVEFFANSHERNYMDGQASVYNRISQIFDRVKKSHKQIFESNDKINLLPRTITFLVAELQKYALLSTDIDIKGKAYEEIVGANLRGDRGEFFTPRNVMKMTVDMMNPQDDEKVLDSSCGTGGFVVTAMNSVIKRLTAELSKSHGPKDTWPVAVQVIFNTRISEIAASNYYGFDINPDLVKATKMNMVMNNDGSGNILQLNSLLPPQEWPEETRKKLADALDVSPVKISNSKHIGFFDVIVTNPPFGAKIPTKDRQILEQFDIARIWEKQADGSWIKTERLQTSVSPEQLFIERIIQLLKEGGRAAIVLPDSILGSPGLEYIRYWLMKETRIIASIDLHADAFQPKNGTQCSVLILQKKTKQQKELEAARGSLDDYEVFMTVLDHIGHDKRGKKVFKRDSSGNIITLEVENTIREINSEGIIVSRREIIQEKLVNDQTVLLSPIFEAWKIKQGIKW